MLHRYLRYILGVGAVLAWLTPALAQQAGDPLTRLLDSFFKPPAGQAGNAQPRAAEQPRPAPAPRAAPTTRAQPPAARAQQPSQVETGKTPPQKAAAPKQDPKPAQPQLQAQPATPKAEPKPEAKPSARPSDGVAETKPEPSKPAGAPPAGAAEQPKPEPKPVEAAAKPAEPAKPMTPPAPVREAPKAAEAPPAQTPPATPVAAKVQAPSPIPASPAAALDQVNSYFNGIDQLSAYFVQKNPNGQQAEGNLSMRRPGQFHFAYAPPSTLEVVSDGRNVAIRDKKLGTNDVYPVGQTPLKFLVQDNIDLARDTKVRDVQVGRDGMVTVRFDDSATLGGTSKITLRFDSRANALKQWTIIDAQGYETSVTLSGINATYRRDARATQ